MTKNMNHSDDELSDIIIDDEEDQEEEKRNHSKKLILVIAMALILLFVVVFAIYALTRDEEPPKATQPPNTVTTPSTSETSSNSGFTNIDMSPNANLANSSQGSSSKDKFEDIIAKIKNEQNKNNNSIPVKPESSNTPPPPVIATPTEDIKDLFKPQQPQPQPPSSREPVPVPTPEPIVTEPAPKPAPKPRTPPKIVNVPSDPDGKYYIQTASLSKFSEDSNLAKKLDSHRLPYKVQEESVNDKTVYRILVGPYGSKDDARKVLPTVKFYFEKEAFIKRVNERLAD